MRHNILYSRRSRRSKARPRRLPRYSKDGLLIGEGGPRFEAEDVVFNTRLLTSAIAVAFWNASHEAAAEVAQNLPGRPWRTGLQGAG